MSLMNVFENLSDAILVVNYEGELTYMNSAASALVEGSELNTLGISRLGDMLALVINDEIALPVRFNVVISKTKQEYSATITKIYSLFIVSLTLSSANALHKDIAHEGQGQTASDVIQNQLKQIENWLQNHNDITESDVLALLQQKINDIHLITSLLLAPQKHQSQASSLSTLIDQAASSLQQRAHATFSIRIYENTRHTITFYCPLEWLIKAFADSLLFIHQLDRDNHVVVNIDFKPFFTGIHFTSVDTDDLTVMDTEQFVSEHVIDKAVSDTAEPNADLAIATNIINKLKGNIRVNRENMPFSLLIQLPSEEILIEETELMLEQGKQFARELAELKSQLDRMPLT